MNKLQQTFKALLAPILMIAGCGVLSSSTSGSILDKLKPSNTYTYESLPQNLE